MQGIASEKRILAIDLRASSFGFVAFEGPTRLLDYGVRSFRRGINAVKVPASTKIATLIEQYEPSAVVLKQWTDEPNGQRARMRGALVRQAALRRIPVRLLSRGVVRKIFAGNDRNKYTIASALAQQFPELSERLPPKRKIWQSEDYRMSIFDAAAVGVAYFNSKWPDEFGNKVSVRDFNHRALIISIANDSGDSCKIMSLNSANQ